MHRGSAPIRCPACSGSGAGQTVMTGMTGMRTYIEPCPSCEGAGQLVLVLRLGCLALPLTSPHRLHVPEP